MYLLVGKSRQSGPQLFVHISNVQSSSPHHQCLPWVDSTSDQQQHSNRLTQVQDFSAWTCALVLHTLQQEGRFNTACCNMGSWCEIPHTSVYHHCHHHLLLKAAWCSSQCGMTALQAQSGASFTCIAPVIACRASSPLTCNISWTAAPASSANAVRPQLPEAEAHACFIVAPCLFDGSAAAERHQATEHNVGSRSLAHGVSTVVDVGRCEHTMSTGVQS